MAGRVRRRILSGHRLNEPRPYRVRHAEILGRNPQRRMLTPTELERWLLDERLAESDGRLHPTPRGVNLGLALE